MASASQKPYRPAPTHTNEPMSMPPTKRAKKSGAPAASTTSIPAASFPPGDYSNNSGINTTNTTTRWFLNDSSGIVRDLFSLTASARPASQVFSFFSSARQEEEPAGVFLHQQQTYYQSVLVCLRNNCALNLLQQGPMEIMSTQDGGATPHAGNYYAV